jgi:hypothetical protein
MYARQTEIVVRIPVYRWGTIRFAVPVREARRHRSLALPVVRHQKGARRGSFPETDARAP